MEQTLIDSSFKYCENIAKNHYENFPVASLLLPSEKRKYIYAIYAFARMADDFADETGFGGKEKRLELLNEMQIKLCNCDKASRDDPVFIALSETIKTFNIPVQYFIDLLSAFRQDVIKNRYNKFEELVEYCKCSANPVGRLVLIIFDIRDDLAFNYSDNICTGLQLTNFWQDVAIDLEKDRIYIPQDDMKSFGYDEVKLKNMTVDNNFIKLLKHEIEVTREFFYNGKILISRLKHITNHKGLLWELEMTIKGGLEILNKIESVNYDVFRNRPKLNKMDFIRLFFRRI